MFGKGAPMVFLVVMLDNTQRHPRVYSGAVTFFSAVVPHIRISYYFSCDTTTVRITRSNYFYQDFFTFVLHLNKVKSSF
jgi:hypothetical protein